MACILHGVEYMYVYMCRSELHNTKTELATVQLQYVQACGERGNTEEEKKVYNLYITNCKYF